MLNFKFQLSMKGEKRSENRRKYCVDKLSIVREAWQ